MTSHEEMDLLKTQVEAHLKEIENLRAIIMERDDTINDILSDLEWNQCYND